MSDDTPTQRLPEPAGDNPTERITTGEVQEDLREEKQRNKGLLIGLIIAGALLLIALIVLVVVLIPKGSGGPQAGDTQSPSPVITQTPAPSESAFPTPAATEEPSEEPAPPSQQPSGPAITSFTVSPGTVYCNTRAPVQPQNQYLTMSWKTVGADEIRIGTYDPYGDYSTRYYNLPPNGNESAIGQDIIYQCPEATQTWRLEIVANGQVIKKEVTIQNNGDQQ